MYIRAYNISYIGCFMKLLSVAFFFFFFFPILRCAPIPSRGPCARTLHTGLWETIAVTCFGDEQHINHVEVSINGGTP